mmetsp:Transcript_1505/g.2935  ORF Transcript_1505/g.2935 Transcript_1505/m.2935 type:complete len:305 (-) Transcript_1505:5-919(-)
MHCIAASVQSAAISAPTNPCVSLAMASGSTSSSSFMLRVWMRKTSNRPFSSGTPMSISRSKRPKRRRAGSIELGRLVAPMTTTLARCLRPSIRVSIWETMRRSTSPLVFSRFGAILSISSMKMMAGDLPLAASNSSRMRLAPRPTYTSSNCDPDAKKNGTPASPAMAFASSVFPVPGGPVRRSPRGSFPPNRVNRSGSFRYSTISSSSALASATPLTSSKRTSLPSASWMCFPLAMAPMPPRPPRPCSVNTTVRAETTTNATRTWRARVKSISRVLTGLYDWTKRGALGEDPRPPNIAPPPPPP